MAGDEVKRLTRKQRERASRRREMLEAAERVFVRKGYHAATVEEIAQEADFAVGTLYNFFKGKEDLYAHVVGKIAQEFMTGLDSQVLQKDDPEEAVGALIELRLTNFEEHRGFFRAFFEASPGSRINPIPALPANCVGLYDRYLQVVSRLFRDGVEKGAFDRVDPFYLTLCLEGIINAFVAYWSGREPTEPLVRRVAKMKDAFLGRLKVHLPETDGAADRPGKVRRGPEGENR